MTEFIFPAACIITILIMLIYYMRREKKITSLLFGVLTGTAALFLINYLGVYIGADIPLNAFNVIGSVVLGVPFVICLVIIEFL